MKMLSEKQALLKLTDLKNDFRQTVRENYEHRAKDCLTCDTKGACCTDAHFVNVHITKLEAVLIAQKLAELPPEKQTEINNRVTETVETYQLSDDGETFAKTFACPLFDKSVGCQIHAVKPAACIQHACYDNLQDLPPDELQTKIESKIEKLNERTYKKFAEWLPLPVWLKNLQS